MAVAKVAFLAGAIALLVSLVSVRSVYRYLAPDAVDRDAYAHLLYVNDIKENDHRLPERPAKAATSGEYAYPFFMHWSLSFLPSNWLLTVDRHFSALSDFAFAGVLLVLWPLGLLTPGETLLTLALFVLTPQFVRPDMPNAIGISSRKPGLLLATASLFSFTLWLNGSTVIALALGTLLGATVYLTSKFSVQALVFTFVGLGIATSSMAVGVLVASLVLAIILSGGAYVAILRGHLAHLYEYATVKQYKIFDPVRLDLVSIIRDTDSAEDLLRVAYHNRVIRPLVNGPYIVGLAAVAWFEIGEGGLTLPVGYRAWILSCVIAFTVTSLPHFLFLGKAERYMEYAFLPASVAIARAWSQFGFIYNSMIICLLVFGGIIIVLYVWAYPRLFYSPRTHTEWDELRSVLEERPPGTVIVQPFWRARRLAWETHHHVVDFVLNEGSTSTEESDRLCPVKYGFVTADVAWLDENYNPDWVVFEKDRLCDIEEDELAPPPEEPIYSNDEFVLYEFETVDDAATYPG